MLIMQIIVGITIKVRTSMLRSVLPQAGPTCEMSKSHLGPSFFRYPSCKRWVNGELCFNYSVPMCLNHFKDVFTLSGIMIEHMYFCCVFHMLITNRHHAGAIRGEAWCCGEA